LLERDGQSYPVTVFRAPPHQQADVDSLLDSAIPNETVDQAWFAFLDRAHLEQRQQAGRTLTNGLCYVLDHMTVNPLRITAKLGYYFDMMQTCDALDHELRDYALGLRDDLPNRERLHAQVPRARLFTSGAGRSTLLGGSALVVFRDAAGYQAVVMQRSASLAIGAGLYHVTPAFVFQPSGPESMRVDDWSLRWQCYRELGEELFNVPEFEEWEPQPQSHTYVFQHPAVADLQAMLIDGRASHHLTGVAFNLLSLRPELCSMLLIDDPAWAQRWRPAIDAAQNNERHAIQYIPLTTLAGLPGNLSQHMTPHGAAAFWLGVEKARALVG
jgi:hypothetical protein